MITWTVLKRASAVSSNGNPLQHVKNVTCTLQSSDSWSSWTDADVPLGTTDTVIVFFF